MYSGCKVAEITSTEHCVTSDYFSSKRELGVDPAESSFIINNYFSSFSVIIIEKGCGSISRRKIPGQSVISFSKTTGALIIRDTVVE